MIFRSAIILPAGLRGAGNQLAVQIGVDPAAQLDTMSVELVPAEGADEAEPTHFACCGIATAEQRAMLEAASGQFPGACWYRWAVTGPEAGKLAASHDGEQLGAAWSWQKCLAAAGLKMRRVPLVREE